MVTNYEGESWGSHWMSSWFHHCSCKLIRSLMLITNNYSEENEVIMRPKICWWLKYNWIFFEDHNTEKICPKSELTCSESNTETLKKCVWSVKSYKQ